MGAKPARVFHVVAVGELGVGEALHQFVEFLALELPGMHGQEWSAGALGELDEILPAIGIRAHFPHNALHFFVIHVAVEAAHAVAFDEGDHVIFDDG